MMPVHIAMLALLQLGANQLNTFETFLNSSVNGIQSSGVISGSMNVAYSIMLIGFLWEVYQAAMHGGDVKSLGKSLVKYLATALVMQSWPTVFTDINHAFVSAGSWMTGQSGASNVLDSWMTSLKGQYSTVGFKDMWGLITGSMAGVVNAFFILIAYLLYPIVTVIFGFFYMMMGSILFVLGPLVISLLPLGAANRIAKSYIEHIFIWNAWPLLYGALGLLITAVHLNDMSTILANGGFLGALNGMEGSFLVGIISIVYSIAIAAIPFMAKSIVTGDVGSAARQMMVAATTAVAAGTAAFAGASAGAASAKAASSAASAGGGNPTGSALGSRSATGSGNQPASPQAAPAAARQSSAPSSQQPQSPQSEPGESSTPDATAGGNGDGSPESAAMPATAAENAAKVNTANAAADAQALQSIGESASDLAKETADSSGRVDGPSSSSTPNPSSAQSSTQTSAPSRSRDHGQSGSSIGNPRSAASQSAGGSHAPYARHGLASWGAYHAARMAAHGAVSAGNAVSGGIGSVRDAIANPAAAGGDLGSAAGRGVGGFVRGAKDIGSTVAKSANAVAQTA
jgi:hypothetical protein